MSSDISSAVKFLSTLKRKGVELRLDGEKLKVDAPKGVLTKNDKNEIASKKSTIVTLIRYAKENKQSAKIPLLNRDEKRIPLSFAQERLWFLQQYDTNSKLYSMPGALRLSGQLNVPVLEKTLRQLLVRHEALRSYFFSTEGVAQIDFHEVDCWHMEIIDLAAVDVSIEEYLINQKSVGFDIEIDFLFKAQLIKLIATQLKNQEYILYFNLHHMVADGWSISLIVNDIRTMYATFLREQERHVPQSDQCDVEIDGGTPSLLLPADAIQYADYAEWQRNQLDDGSLDQSLAYWKDNLSGSEVIDLPYDRKETQFDFHDGSRFGFDIPQPVVEKLRKIGLDNNATLFQVLIAAFNVFLYKYTGQTDISVGTPVAGRSKVELENVVGLFVNTLVLRSRIDSSLGFTDYVRNVSHENLAAFSHQAVPFEKVVEILQPDRNDDASPLFQVMFVLQNTPDFNLSLPGLDISLYPLEWDVAKFDLTFDLKEYDDGIQVAIEYRKSLFSVERIEQMAAHYQQLLQAISRAPYLTIAELNILSPEEQSVIAHFNNDTSVEWPSDTLVELIDNNAVSKKDKVAVSCGVAEISYAELKKRSDYLARQLMALGCTNGTPIGVCMDRSVEMLVTLLAVWKANATYIPLDPSYPLKRLVHMLRESQALFLITQRHLYDSINTDSFESDIKKLVVNSHLVLDSANDTECAGSEQVLKHDEEHLAYVIFTSGSTGVPKGVCIDKRSVKNFLLSMSDSPGLGETDCFLAVTPISFDIHVLELFLPLLVGAHLIIGSREETQDGALLKQLIEKRQVSCMQATPSTWKLLTANEWKTTRPFKALCGGEPLSHSLKEKLLNDPNIVLWNMYGPTETTVWSSVAKQAHGESISIGRPIANTQYYVLNRNKQIVPMSIPGELYIAGQGLSSGYLHRDDLTKERFVHLKLPNQKTVLAYQTGDRVCFDHLGNLHYMERLDNQIKLRGYRIELEEVENALLSIEKLPKGVGGHIYRVEDCVAVIQNAAALNRFTESACANVELENEKAEHRQLVMFAVIKSTNTTIALDDKPICLSYIKSCLEAKLPHFMVPTSIHILEKLPLLPNGKVDRKALSKTLSKTKVEESAPESLVAPRDAIEKRVMQIWKSILNKSDIGVKDNFFSVGGHSLLATRILSKIENEFSFKTPVKTIFNSPTIEGISRLIREAHDNNDIEKRQTIARIDRHSNTYKDGYPLSYAQERMWFLDRLSDQPGLYSMPSAVVLNGELDVQRLEQAFIQVVRENETLRLSFHELQGQLVQRIDSSRSFSLNYVDLSHLDREEAEKQVKNSIQLDLRNTFNLARSLLIRATLYKIAPLQHTLYVNVHHIIADGWSTFLFVDLLVKAYISRSDTNSIINASNDIVAQEQSDHNSKAQEIHYVDYACWQRSDRRKDVLDKKVEYWVELLKDVKPLNLPYRHQLRQNVPLQGKRKLFSLSRELLAKLRSLSNEQGVTLYITLLSVFKLFLSTYCRQTDVSIGTPVANRNLLETERLLGLFANTVVIRTQIDKDKSFLFLLDDVKNSSLAAQENEEAPFEQVVHRINAFNKTETMAYPLFQVMFSWQVSPINEMSLPELLVSSLPLDTGLSKFPITVDFQESLADLQATVEFNTFLLDEKIIDAMIVSYTDLLEQVIVNADLPLRRLSLMNGNDGNDLSVDRQNNTVVEAVFGEHTTLVGQAFEAQVKKQEGEISLNCDNMTLTYGELNSRANKVARYLLSKTIGEGTIVAIHLPRTIDTVVLLIALQKIGAIYVPVDIDYPEARKAFILKDCEAAFIIDYQQRSTALSAEKIDTDLKILKVDDINDNCINYDDSDLALPIDENIIAYIIYTSGTTGNPKGVCVKQSILVEHCLSINTHYQINRNDRVLQFASYSFDASLEQLLVTLINGAALYMRGQAQWSAFECVEYIRKNQLTVVNFPPSYWRSMLEALEKEEDSKSLAGISVRMVILGGEALRTADVAAFRKNFHKDVCLYNAYGPTEAVITSTLYQIQHDEKQGCEINDSVPIGHPVGGRRILILDENDRRLPVGAIGEIVIGGDLISEGYLGREILTKTKFLKLTCRENNNTTFRCYRSGDLGRIGGDGKLYYLGRLDEQVKLRGFRIELGEIESVIVDINDVVNCTVSVWENNGEQTLVAYVVRFDPQEAADETADETADDSNFIAELREKLFVRLPNYMLPAHYEIVKSLPVTANGKIDRNALPPPKFTEKKWKRDIVSPRNEIEREMVDIWKELLVVDAISTEDNFFELGGHSLMGTRLVSLVRQRFNKELPLRALFETKTLSELCECVQNEKTRTNMPYIEKTDKKILSYAQERMWFLEHFQPGSGLYHINSSFRLLGAINIDLLESAIRSVIAKHESLRSRFLTIDGKPELIVEPHIEWSLQRVVMPLDTSKTRDQQVEQMVEEWFPRPFDLSRGPLIDSCIVKEKENVYRLLMSIHHIVSDGWSSGVFINEVASYYAMSSFSNDKQPCHDNGCESKSNDNLQYSDFAHWQRQLFKDDFLEKQKEYWAVTLSHVQPLQLTSDYKRQAKPAFDGDRYYFDIEANNVNTLKSISSANNTTLYTLMLTAFKVLLFRYTGQIDITVGTPVANRHLHELESMIGYFANTLTLRSTVESHCTLADLLMKVKETVLAASEHQDIPFEQVVELVSETRDVAISPLFQVMFVMQNKQAIANQLASICVLPETLPVKAAKFEITLELVETDSGIVGAIEYRTQLFKRSTIGRMVEHYKNILKYLVEGNTANNDDVLKTSIGDIPLLSEAERSLLLKGFGAKSLRLKHHLTLVERFEKSVLIFPNKLALKFNDKKMSYLELNEKVNQLSRYLQTQGVKPRQLVALSIERSLDMVIAILAVLKTGCTYVPIDPAAPQERIALILNDCGANYLIGEECVTRTNSKNDVQQIDLQSCLERSMQFDRHNLNLRISTQDLAYIIYTSGSTGIPKGVKVSHYNVDRLINSTQREFNFNEHDVWTLFHSYAFDFSIWEIWGALGYGGTLVVVPFEITRSTDLFYELIQAEKVTVLNQTPSAFSLLQRHICDLYAEPHCVSVSDANVSRNISIIGALRAIVFGGEALDMGALSKWNDCFGVEHPVLVNMYGITETTVHATYKRITPDDIDSSSGSNIGTPLADLEIRLVDKEGQIVPIGVPGEITISGGGVTQGYLNRDQLTLQRFKQVPNIDKTRTKSKEEVFYYSGDLAKWTADGELEYLGRIDRQVKVRGFRIEPGEIESIINENSSVDNSVVVVKSDRNSHESIVAYVALSSAYVSNADYTIDAASQINETLAKRLPAYMLPKAIILLDNMPLNHNGKIDLTLLPAPDFKENAKSRYAAPITDNQKVLVKIWEKILCVENIGVHDNFFELGGDSILSIQVISRARRKGMSIGVKDLFEHQTIAALCSVAENSRVSCKAEQGIVKGSSELTPIQHWFFNLNLPNRHYYNQSILFSLDRYMSSSTLQQAFEAVLWQHDVLRSRFVVGDNVAHQKYLNTAQVNWEEYDCQLELVDQSLQNIIHAHTSLAQAKLDIQNGPLITIVRYVNTGDGNDRLFIVVHHLVIDGVSWRILLEDLEFACEQIENGQTVNFGLKTTSYKEWSIALNDYAKTNRFSESVDYWKRVVTKQEVLLQNAEIDTLSAKQMVKNLTTDLTTDLTTKKAQQPLSERNELVKEMLTLSVEDTAILLRQANRAYRTELPELLVAALVRAIKQFTGMSKIRVALEGHGREAISDVIDVTRTVGWFTTLYPIDVEMNSTGNISLDIIGIKEAFRAIPNRGFDFSLYWSSVKDLLPSTVLGDVSFNYLGQLDSVIVDNKWFSSAQEETAASVDAANVSPFLLESIVSVTHERLNLALLGSRRLFDEVSLSLVLSMFKEHLLSIIKHCANSNVGEFTPSDFPLAKLEQNEIKNIITKENEQLEEIEI